MKNILIFGAGRSGTSLLAGLFSEAGYHMGERLYPGRDSNPKGFFESGEINGLNESILKYNAKRSLAERLCKGYNRRLKQWQRWLSLYSRRKRFVLKESLAVNIQLEAKKVPFCYKDPRFSYTYPLWAPYCGEHACLVVYRHPAKTVESMVKEIEGQPYLKGCDSSVSRLLRVWEAQYSYILSVANSNFMFVHFDQLFDPAVRANIQHFVGCCELIDFPDKALMRSTGRSVEVSQSCLNVYARLNQKSGMVH